MARSQRRVVMDKLSSSVTGWDPSVCKSNRFTCSHPPVFLHKIGVFSVDSSKLIGNFPADLNFNRLFLKLNWFICNQLPVLPNHRCQRSLRHWLRSKGQIPAFWIQFANPPFLEPHVTMCLRSGASSLPHHRTYLKPPFTRILYPKIKLN